MVLGTFQSAQKNTDAFTESSSSAANSNKAKTTNDLYPAGRLDLSDWKITLPVDSDDDDTPDEVKQPKLQTFALPPYFAVTTNGVMFRAYADGATTDNSGYPRSELREMTENGQEKASWSNSRGSHSMSITQAITHLPDVKREVVAGQIHDASDDVVMIRLEGSRLFVEAEGEDIGELDSSYVLGEKFTVKILAQNNKITVFYNNIQKVTYNKSGTGYYFKAGCYTQTNTSKGDSVASYGEVIIYDLKVTHTQ